MVLSFDGRPAILQWPIFMLAPAAGGFVGSKDAMYTKSNGEGGADIMGLPSLGLSFR